ncbi:O-sialoglycoprotein endopeptidase [Anaerophilus nitritogenes]|uniref:O-sialoglycoprotein endopeptidase n=1 Tax=Anaerophilus nitritogenes TaxID=2498136 RepID=UPI00101C3D51|nr:O-sialoglycoprotein endopeptidase [Anaerophilus nitritogenes]
MMKNLVLGIDTSNYTTSIAVVDENNHLLFEDRKLLDVKIGKRGLRQSDALFQHVVNLPLLFEKIDRLSIGHLIKTICVSNKPRPMKDSYMPVFKTSQSFGKVLSHTLCCEYKEFSHQEGHIEAAKWSISKKLKSEFLAIHLSGGTSEILHVINNKEGGYIIDIIGGSSDISAGQFIDRIGVALGISFPCGKEMDTFACTGIDQEVSIPVSIKDTYMSFSGPETFTYKLIEKEYEKSIICASVFKCISIALAKTIEKVIKKTALTQVLISGGVASSIYIKQYIHTYFENKEYDILFGHAKYCTDNAVGIALLGNKNKKGGIINESSNY